MDRINGAGHVNRRFVMENVAAGRPPTEITYEWLNGVQEELCAVIEAAGIALNSVDAAQLLKAIVRLGPQTGEVAFFAQSAAPAGYLKANGAAVSRTAYAALFTAIGTFYGAGDGATTFNLPDLRGEFLRGFDDGRGVDSGRGLGSTQRGTLVAGEIDSGLQVSGMSASGAGSYSSNWYADQPSSTDLAGKIFTQTSDAAGTPQVASNYPGYVGMTRPRNIALLACIRC